MKTPSRALLHYGWMSVSLLPLATACSAGDVPGTGDPETTSEVQLAACSTVTLSANPRIVAQGTPITVSAEAFCNVGETASYRFLHQPPGASQFTQIRGWGSSSFDWSTAGLADGGHLLKVQARATGVSAGSESKDNLVVNIGNTCYRLTSLSISPASLATVGDLLTLTAASECSPGESPEYQFLLRDIASQQTTLLRSWGGAAFQWDSSAAAPGDYEVVAQVRAVGNLSLKEATRRTALTLEVGGTCVTETCNGVDDDCDTQCDEGFVCCAGTTGNCTTSCGSTGTRSCNGNCAWGACMPPVEICNGMDDDCDGQIDEGCAAN